MKHRPLNTVLNKSCQYHDDSLQPDPLSCCDASPLNAVSHVHHITPSHPQPVLQPRVLGQNTIRVIPLDRTYLVLLPSHAAIIVQFMAGCTSTSLSADCSIEALAHETLPRLQIDSHSLKLRPQKQQRNTTQPSVTRQTKQKKHAGYLYLSYRGHFVFILPVYPCGQSWIWIVYCFPPALSVLLQIKYKCDKVFVHEQGELLAHRQQQRHRNKSSTE